MKKIQHLMLSGLLAFVGFATLAPTLASAAPMRRGSHKECHWDRHHQRICHWVRNR